jgi:hypothetical protein
MASSFPAPRIYCIPATKAPVVAVFRRGPTEWAHIGKWNLAHNTYEPGAWLHGRLFPRRSDLSPDGQWLCYFAHKPNATWEHGPTYIALSKLPWLTALHAWSTCGTWTRGYYFSEDESSAALNSSALPIPYSLNSIPIIQFAQERRRGWLESPDSPPRHRTDAWDQHRKARLYKPQPGSKGVLHVESLGWAGGEFSAGQAVDGLRVLYSLEVNGELEILDDLQWADWDQQGRLLVATRSGRLQIRKLNGRDFLTEFDVDLGQLQPDPVEPPDWATHW